jgi:site-specific DNA-methyltransferase (adenine-specific)
MGKAWDLTGIAFSADTWRKALRVLKPGGYLVAFTSTRTYHRIACAIEDAGFKIKDQLAWVYGNGFPKSRTCLKPAWEPICLARKPMSEKSVAANVLRWGTCALNVAACRVDGQPSKPGNATEQPPRYQSGIIRLGAKNGKDYGERLERGEITGRWPANICHDGSNEVLAAFPDGSGNSARIGGPNKRGNRGIGYGGGKGREIEPPKGFDDSGSVARFFYCTKASKSDRAGSKHPTVKPVKLMRWLCRLVTPPGGVVLDPFAGSGTTGEAALSEGFKVILIEREADYQADIRQRIAAYKLKEPSQAA